MNSTPGNLPDTRRMLRAGTRDYKYFSLTALAEATRLDIAALPVSLKILLENLLRHCDERNVTSRMSGPSPDGRAPGCGR
jgi:aconitase A